MNTQRLYQFDPNLESAAGHYLGYNTRVAQAAEEIGISAVIVANVKMDPKMERESSWRLVDE